MWCMPSGPAPADPGRDEDLLSIALTIATKLPGTRAALRDGIIRLDKAQIIACAAANLDPGEAQKAEALVLGRAGRLTPGGLRAAIARAVIEVAPDKARKRREQAARDARVQRWAEDSGNAALMGRELPPAEVLAADQRITAWARELKRAGLDGDMDVLRARAYLDILLDKDSRPRQDTVGGPDSTGQDGTGPNSTGPNSTGPNSPGGAGPGDAGPGGGPESAGSSGPSPGSRPGVVPAGFAGRINLTVPLSTLLDLADRPGEIPGIGPIDPWLARDLARAAAANPKTTWCVTVTDQDGHAIGHGCARPEPKSHARCRDKPDKPDPPDEPEPGFSFTAASQHGPPGGYGSWRLRSGVGAPCDLIVALDPITTGDCDHRYEARGHDPGVKLRHLSQVRHATCTGLLCRRPAAQCDFEHNTPCEAGGRTCLCNGGPKCRYDHRLKQHPQWHVDQLPDGTFRWTTPSGRQHTTEPTRYPIKSRREPWLPGSTSHGPAVQEGRVPGRDVGPEHGVQVHRRRVLAGRNLTAQGLGHGPDVMRAGAAADAHVVRAELAGLQREVRQLEARAAEGVERDREGPLSVR